MVGQLLADNGDFTLNVRHATPADIPGILRIYNEVIESSTAVYEMSAVPLSERTAWYENRTSDGYPVLVAENESEIIGFASFGPWRGAWPGYRYTVEHTVHVKSEWRGKGVGGQLLKSLFPLALALGKHVMIGGVDAGNEASLRFHAKLGFERVAHFKEVGHKFGRWLDLVFLQRFLDAPGTLRE
jgi:phosphinothricin acetyltransferase